RRVRRLWIVLRRHDGDRRRGARHLAELAADAHLKAVVVPAQFVAAPEPRAAGLLLFGIPHGHLFAEQVAQGGAHALCNASNHPLSTPSHNEQESTTQKSATAIAVPTRLRTASGSITFQPKFIRRSYRRRGSVALIQMKTKISKATLTANQ